MNVIISAINWFGALPGPVMMFIIFFVVNLLLGIKPGKSLRAAFQYAMGLFALSTFAFDVFLGTVAGVGNAMVDRLGLNMTAVDFGSGVTPIMLAEPMILWAIPIGIALNFVMIALKLTKTLDVDIYNMLYFWGSAGVLTYYATGKNVLYGVLAIILTGIMTLKVADWAAPHIHKAMPQYTGLSFPYVYSAFYAPVAYWFNKLFDKIPFVRDSKVSADDVRKKVGVFGEPGIMGFILGMVMAVLGGYDFASILQTGIKLGAALYFVPLSTKILIEGLNETTSVLTQFVQNKFKNREIYIGLDGVVAAGAPECLAVGLLLVPIALLVSVILPGNTVLPIGMLSVGFILVALYMPFFQNNILKGTLFCFIVVACELYIGTALAPLYTEIAVAGGVEIPYGAMQITNAANFPNIVCVYLFKLINGIVG